MQKTSQPGWVSKVLEAANVDLISEIDGNENHNHIARNLNVEHPRISEIIGNVVAECRKSKKKETLRVSGETQKELALVLSGGGSTLIRKLYAYCECGLSFTSNTISAEPVKAVA